VKKINNIEKIKNFIHDEKNKNLIINQVSEDIGEFYFQVIKDISKDIEIKLLRETEDKNMNISNDLFIQREIKIYNMTNSNSIEKLFKRNSQKIIISDYKNYKKFLNKCETVNGYEFDNDIRYYLINYLKINNEDLINYCISQPYLTNSEVSKYAVNKNNYISDSLVYEIDNFILEIRKEIYSLKHKNINIKKLFFILKNEVKYKKFNFLTY
tara:strand:+ start:16146 stop:16781 length:636 start_codon:yes stop_codon:yes gene_type:complete